MPSISSVHEFASFRLDAAERLLLRAGQPISLTPKAFDLLVYLVERPGRLVAKQELLNSIWPDANVEETNLTYTMSALRKALGDGQDGDQLIQTVPTRGYRFVAPVTREVNPSLSSTSGKPSGSSSALVRAIVIAALAVAVIATLATVFHNSRQTTDPLTHHWFTIPLPDSAGDVASAEARYPAAQISPDGRRVAFIVHSPWGTLARRIWFQRLDGLHPEEAKEVTGSDGALSLFWAPDSDQLGFFTLRGVKKFTVSNGTVQTLCDACQPAPYDNGTWSRSGLILFPSRDGRLIGLRDAGGEPEAITSVDRSRGDLRHMAPRFLPDGQRFLYVIRNADPTRNGVYVGQIGSAEPKLLFQGEQPAIYASGYLLFDRAGYLVARPFDLARLEFSGDPITLFELDRRLAPVSVSDTGVLTRANVEFPRMQFQWVRRTGEPLQLTMEPGDYRSFDLSPDGKLLAFTKSEATSTSLWVHDVEQGQTKRWTHGNTVYTDPRWTKDSQRLLANRWEPEPRAVVQVSPDGRDSVVSALAPSTLDDVSEDGQYLLYRGRGSLFAQPLAEGSKPDIVRTAPSGLMDQSQFSPDKRWIAYHADETGGFEVYVTPFPGSGASQPISSGGGVQPVWRSDGRELYYLGLDGTLHAVEVRADGERLHLSTIRRLFQTGIVAPSKAIEQYAASPDGQRFLILKPVNKKVRSSIDVVLNWPALLTATQSR